MTRPRVETFLIKEPRINDKNTCSEANRGFVSAQIESLGNLILAPGLAQFAVHAISPPTPSAPKFFFEKYLKDLPGKR